MLETILVSALFESVMQYVFGHEGGFANHAADRGKATMRGITEELARACGYQGEMCDLTEDEAKKIYAKQFWLPLKLQEISEISPALAAEVMDSAVNCGPGTAGKWLQESLNLLNRNQSEFADLKVDGQIGGQTLAALAKLKMGDLPILVKAMNGQQFAHYRDICRRDPSQEVFFRGWLTRVDFKEG